MSLKNYVPEYMKSDDLDSFLDAIESEDIKSYIRRLRPGSSAWNTEQLRYLAGTMPPDLLSSIIPIVGMYFKLKGTNAFLDFLYSYLGMTESYQNVWEDAALAAELGVENSDARYRMIYIPSYEGIDRDKLEMIMTYALPMNVSFVFGNTIGGTQEGEVTDYVQEHHITYPLARVSSANTPVGRCGSVTTLYNRVYRSFPLLEADFLANPEDY